MKKSLKILAYMLSGMVIFAIILPIVVSIVLQIGSVQNFVVRKASEILSDVAGTRISIGHVDLKFFTSVKLDDVLMEDLAHDTMIYARNVNVDINGINFFTGKISLGAVTLNHGRVNLAQDSTGTMNIDRVFAAFRPEKPPQDPPNFRLTAGELTLVNTSLRIRMHNAAPDKYGVNWQDFFFRRIDFQARDISIFNYSAWLRLDHLSLTERSGWRVNHMSSTRCGVDSSGMYYAGVKLTSGDTRIELDSMNFLTANRSWWDWTDFEHKMHLRAIVRKADVSSSTLGYIIGQKFEHPFAFDLQSATVFGPLCDMSGGVRQIGFRHTRADLQYSIKGLPNIDSTYFSMRLLGLKSSGPDIGYAYSRITGGELVGGAHILKNSGELNLKGQFKGRLQNFRSDVVLNSSVAGVVAANLSMKPNRGGGIMMVGSVSTENFEAGKVLNVSSLGRVSFGGEVKARLEPGKPIKLGINALISSLAFGDYTYRGIEATGDVMPAGFKGRVESRDTNLNFTAVGLFDLAGKEPKYDFEMELRRADLNAIGFNDRDTISVLSAEVRAWASGRTIDDINGSCRIDNILYMNHLDTIRTGVVQINSQNTAQLKEITVESDFADISLRGRNSFTEIFRYFSQSLERFLPSFPEATQIVTRSKYKEPVPAKRGDIPFSDGYYQLRVSLKDANNVASAFVPGLQLADDSKLNFFFNPYLDQFSLHATSDLIESNTLLVENFVLDSRNHADSLSMYLTSDYMRVAGIGMPELSIIGGVRNNIITLDGRFIDTASRTNVLLRTITTFVRGAKDEPQMKVALRSTPITLRGEKWALSPATVLIDSTGFRINNFLFTDGTESFGIEGKIGRHESDTVLVMFRDVDLSAFSPIVSDLGYKIGGSANGDARLVSAFGVPRLFAAVDFKDVKLNNHSLGNPKLRSTFDSENVRIKFALGENLLSPPIDGYYALKSGNWGGNIRFDQFDMSILEPLLSGIMSSTKGTAKVDLELRGKGDLPELSGTVDIESYNATIDFTKVRYSLAGRVDVKNNRFELAKTPFRDPRGGQGVISAWFDSKHFKDLSYGVQATFTDLLALNTTVADNSSFYGKAWGTGRLSLAGNESRTNISIAAQTAGNSIFTLPMSGSSTIESADFIRFVDPKVKPTTTRSNRSVRQTQTQTQTRTTTNELDIKIDLNVLPNTLAEIEFDAKIGDVIKGRGEGNIAMHINPSQDLFNMTGSVAITEGKYLFTLMTIFQRPFTINPGSTITWTGVASNPLLNVGASYRVKTSLGPISTGVQSGVNSTANIDCGLNLAGNMLSPDISFSIQAPAADPEIQNLIRNAINTQESLSMQFLSLVLSNTFMPDANAAAIGTMGSSFVGVTGIEFLTNQLSQMISSDKVNVRLGYRMATTQSSEEYYAGVGGNIIDGLSINVDGNYATGNSPSYNARNPFSVDADLTWNINKKGTLLLKGFTRTIDRFDETQGLQESGVGIYFRQDFVNLADLRKRLKKSFELKQKAKQEASQKTDSTRNTRKGKRAKR